jgi:hypothetical protein
MDRWYARAAADVAANAYSYFSRLFSGGAVGGAAALSILTAPRHGANLAAAAQRTNVAVLAWLGLLVLLFTGRSLPSAAGCACRG